jgi:hypothetical protein
MIDHPAPATEEAARRLISKLRSFIAEQLSEEEAALFAALIAPGVALAYTEDEVSGFGAQWEIGTLPEAMCKALQEGGIRVAGLRD